VDEENLRAGWVAPLLRRDGNAVRSSDYERLVFLLLRQARAEVAARRSIAPAQGTKQRKNVDIIVLASLQMDTN
jgi:hypothetical protein